MSISKTKWENHQLLPFLSFLIFNNLLRSSKYLFPPKFFCFCFCFPVGFRSAHWGLIFPAISLLFLYWLFWWLSSIPTAIS
jgi:hypothetical protein